MEEIEREDWQIIIEFSIPINPETVTRDSIIINGEPLPSDVNFLFDRKGIKMAIYEHPQWADKIITIEIKNIMSYNNEVMITPLSPVRLRPDDEYEWDD